SWAAVAGLALGLVAAARLAVTLWRLRRPSPQAQAQVVAAYDPDDTDPARRTEIARAWHEAEALSTEAQRALGFLLVVTVVVVVLGVAGFLTYGAGLLTRWPVVVGAANLA